MNTKLKYSELIETVCTVSEHEIQQAVLKQLNKVGYKGSTFVYNYNEDGDVSGATVTFSYK
jgi:hypothetical protein